MVVAGLFGMMILSAAATVLAVRIGEGRRFAKQVRSR